MEKQAAENDCTAYGFAQRRTWLYLEIGAFMILLAQMCLFQFCKLKPFGGGLSLRDGIKKLLNYSDLNQNEPCRRMKRIRTDIQDVSNQIRAKSDLNLNFSSFRHLHSETDACQKYCLGCCRDKTNTEGSLVVVDNFNDEDVTHITEILEDKIRKLTRCGSFLDHIET